MLFIIAITYLTLALVSADDPAAQKKCAELNHVTVDAAGTAYSNYKCKLTCSIHGQLSTINSTNGITCPELVNTPKSYMVCKDGECVTPIKLGFIDVEFGAAVLNKSANVFISECTQNFTEAVTLPLKDKSKCVTCVSKVLNNTANPEWDELCGGVSNIKFSNQAQVHFEVWDKVSATDTKFLGGVTVNINKMLEEGNNKKTLHLDMMNGTTDTGKLFVHVTWTVVPTI